MAALDWLIIGGGVHGTHLSHMLVNQAGVSASRIRVVDPHERPLAAFWQATAATGMSYLRSSGVHHLDVHPYALRRYAKRSAGRRVARFVYPYYRPGLELFRSHTEAVVRDHQLEALRERGRAIALSRIESGYRIETDRGELTSKRVVIAIGLGEQLCVPDWAREVPVEHMFAPTFDRAPLRGRSVAIIGGGISAAQLACALGGTAGHVTIIARHLPRIHRLDSDPEWLGPKAMSHFERVKDLRERRRLIVEARHRGSMPPEMATALRREMDSGRVEWLQASVVAATAQSGEVRLELDRDKKQLTVGRIVLATGFETHRPGGSLLDNAAVDALGLRCAACGYPIVSRHLEWGKGLFVTGPLAELELGPTARNIAGARAAARRLLAAA